MQENACFEGTLLPYGPKESLLAKGYNHLCNEVHPFHATSHFVLEQRLFLVHTNTATPGKNMLKDCVLNIACRNSVSRDMDRSEFR